MATHRPPSLFGTPRRGPVSSPRARDAAGVVLPPLETRRESASKRGYGHRWAKCRARVLAANPLCAACLKKSLYVPAALVDHIEPVASHADPKFYCLSNLQPLCRACHAKKTWADTRQGKNRAGEAGVSAARGVARARAENRQVRAAPIINLSCA